MWDYLSAYSSQRLADVTTAVAVGCLWLSSQCFLLCEGCKCLTVIRKSSKEILPFHVQDPFRGFLTLSILSNSAIISKRIVSYSLPLPLRVFYKEDRSSLLSLLHTLLTEV